MEGRRTRVLRCLRSVGGRVGSRCVAFASLTRFFNNLASVLRTRAFNTLTPLTRPLAILRSLEIAVVDPWANADSPREGNLPGLASCRVGGDVDRRRGALATGFSTRCRGDLVGLWRARTGAGGGGGPSGNSLRIGAALYILFPVVLPLTSTSRFQTATFTLSRSSGTPLESRAPSWWNLIGGTRSLPAVERSSVCAGRRILGSLGTADSYTIGLSFFSGNHRDARSPLYTLNV